MGCVVTPIVGRPRPLSRHRHAQTTGTCLYTLICEEPDIHKVTGRHLLAFARAVGVDGGDVLASAHEMASLMPMAFAVAMDGTPIDRSDDQAWLSETLERLATHCAHVLTMLERTR